MSAPDLETAEAQAATEPGQHTPGLWAWEEGQAQICAPDWDGQRIVVAEVIATGLKYHENPEKASEEAGTNARRIVLAVNCHDDMKRELGQTISDMRSLLSLIDAEGYAEDVDLLAIVEIANQVADRHAAAIAKAGCWERFDSEQLEDERG